MNSKAFKRFDWGHRSQRFSIRKCHVGAASILLGTALIFGHSTTALAETPASDQVSATIVSESPSGNIDQTGRAPIDTVSSLVDNNQSLVDNNNENLVDEQVSEVTFTLSKEYIDALNERSEQIVRHVNVGTNGKYNNQTGEWENVERLSPDSQEVQDNLNKLRAASEKLMQENTYTPTVQDQRVVGNILSLTEEERLEVNYFAHDIINQIRTQVGTRTLETNVGMHEFANDVADSYPANPDLPDKDANGNWLAPKQGQYNEQYNYKAINDSAAKHGLRNEVGQPRYERYANQETVQLVAKDQPADKVYTMGDLKTYVYDGLKKLMFEPFFTGGRNYERAVDVAGNIWYKELNNLNSNSISIQTSPWDRKKLTVVLHTFFEVYNAQGVPGNFKLGDENGNGIIREWERVEISQEEQIDKLRTGQPVLNTSPLARPQVAKPVVTTELRQTEEGVNEVEVTTLNGQSSEKLVRQYKNTRHEEVVPFTTDKQLDSTLPKGEEKEITPGQNGLTVTGTKYTVDANGQLITTDLSSESKDPVKRVVRIGTKEVDELKPVVTIVLRERSTKDGVDKVQVTTLNGEITEEIIESYNNIPRTETVVPIPVEEQLDPTLPKGRTEVAEGKEGKRVVGITYTVVDGTLVKTDLGEYVAPIARVIRVGTKEVEIPLPEITTVLRETEDGVDEVEVTTLDGEVTGETVINRYKNERTEVIVPYTIIEEEDATLTKGERVLKVKGENGKTVTGVVYTIFSGKLVSTDLSGESFAAIQEVVRVGTKEEVQSSKPQVITIWRQTATGAEQVEVTSVNGQIIGEKVLEAKISTRQETPIPFKIELFEDETKAKGSKVLVQKGVDGKQTTGVIYTVVNGELVTTPLNEIIEPVTERIAMGTKPASQLVQTHKPAVNETKNPVVSPAPAAKSGNGTVQSAQPLASATQAAAPSQTAQTSKATLPNTGEKENISMTLGATLLSMALGVMGFKKREN